jgi:two-component system, chemotaxis family, protein-glutamate methylesterase/glutaminase
MNTAVAASSHGSALAHEPIRVMVVDDAVVVRGMIMRWVEAEPDMQIVASLRGGREAIEQVERRNPDVVILDVAMPDMDGITALPLLFEKKRDLVVLMASTLTRRNAEISLRALSLGAADYIPKPESNREFTTSISFRRELIDKIRALGSRRKRGPSSLRIVPAPAAVPTIAPAPAPAPVREELRGEPQLEAPAIAPSAPDTDTIQLRPLPPTVPRVLLIGSSTGGPQALTALVARIAPVFERAPVLITQHMPPTFTTILAEHLARASGRNAHEAVEGEAIAAGKIYLAPGGRHMTIAKRNNQPVIALNDGPLVNFCRPAVDPLFASAAQAWGGVILATILTGMGSDGVRGAEDIVAAGGSVIAQDEATSVVWGMPGAVANAGVCSAVLPLDQIGPKIVRLFGGDKA